MNFLFHFFLFFLRYLSFPHSLYTIYIMQVYFTCNNAHLIDLMILPLLVHELQKFRVNYVQKYFFTMIMGFILQTYLVTSIYNMYSQVCTFQHFILGRYVPFTCFVKNFIFYTSSNSLWLFMKRFIFFAGTL